MEEGVRRGGGGTGLVLLGREGDLGRGRTQKDADMKK